MTERPEMFSGEAGAEFLSCAAVSAGFSSQVTRDGAVPAFPPAFHLAFDTATGARGGHETTGNVFV